MTLGMVVDPVGVSALGDAVETVFAKAHNPGKQQVATGSEGGLGESRVEVVDDGLERQYHSPHGGLLVLQVFAKLEDRRNPLSWHPLTPAAQCSPVHRKLRKFRDRMAEFQRTLAWLTPRVYV